MTDCNYEMSVVIPTYNRRSILEKCLQALFKQTCLSSKFEILVVDDGSTDGTEEAVAGMVRDAPVKTRYFRQQNRGPAAARNVGIKNAAGRIVLIVGDDIIATPDLIEEHLSFHEIYPDDCVAILGFVTWSPEIEMTPFMHYLENGGPQFRYFAIDHNQEVSFRFFVTCNISLKRIFLLQNGLFDERFKRAAFEDTELALRLRRRGMRIVYNRNAVGYHDHPSDLMSVKRRMECVGKAAVVWYRRMKAAGQEENPFFSSNHRKEKLKNAAQKLLFNRGTVFFLSRALPYLDQKGPLQSKTTPLYNQLMYHYYRRGVSTQRLSRQDRVNVEIFLKRLSAL